MAIGLIPGPLGKVLTPTTSPTRTVTALSTFRQATPITIAKSTMTPMRSISTMTVPISQPSGGIVAAIKNMTAAPVTGIHSSGISFGGGGAAGSGPAQSSGGAASRFGGSVTGFGSGVVAPPSPSGADNTSQPSVPMAPLQATPTPGQPSFDGGSGGGAPDELAPAQADGGMLAPTGMSFSPTMIAVGAALALGVGLLLLRRPSAAPQILKV